MFGYWCVGFTLLYLAAALISIMADKRYRSGALKRRLKNERQRREKEALSKLKMITGFFTPVTPQPDVPLRDQWTTTCWRKLLEPI